MRLIDADALKNEVDSWGCNDYDKYDFLEAIDNTPTVPLPDFKEGYKQAILDGKTNFSGPQGKWIMDKEHTKNSLLWYKCNLCGVYHSPTNFCPICGADMRGDNNGN